MAQSLRQVRNRIHTVGSIHKITRAMEMVSIAKLRAIQKSFSVSREYFLRISGILNNILTSFETAGHSLLAERLDKKKMLLCLITSDTGLCGVYNNIIMRETENFIRKNNAYDISMLVVGRKGLCHFKKAGVDIQGAYTELYGHYSSEISDKIADDLINSFLSGKADEVYVSYMNFESASRHKPALEKILNIEATKGNEADYLTEPDINTILEELIPLYIKSKIRCIMLSAFTAEHSARVMAMSEATDNAEDLIGDLTVLRNKMRQELITGEIIEIISAVNALSGR